MLVTPPATTLTDCLETALRQHAGRWALRAGAERWRYADLDAASRGWAVALGEAGLQPGGCVGVWLPKSLAAVAAQVAILRAGGVYVPLDPLAPPQRVAALVAAGNLDLLCTAGPLEAAAAAWQRPGLRLLTPAFATPPGIVATLPPHQRRAPDLAYILYTSGSTGTPKGVMLSHAHAVNFVTWAAQTTALGATDRLSSHAPFHFDLSIFDLWAGLSVGAEICLLDPVTAKFPAAVLDWIEAQQITVWYSVPSALAAMAALLPAADAPSSRLALRQVIFAGEVFPPQPLNRWRAALPAARFHNWYGPTETNVCTAYALPPGPGPAPEPLPLGEACAGFEVEIRNADGQPVVPGVAGLLWARGPGTLSGYWSPTPLDPPGPASAGPPLDASGWYNTGDLVRRSGAPPAPGATIPATPQPPRPANAPAQRRPAAERTAGVLYFCGRRDDQIKLRGYRVSLLEVAGVLRAFAGVAELALVAGPEPCQWLDAYVVWRALPPQASHAAPPAATGPAANCEGAGRDAALRAHGAAHLPGYMLPERIYALPALPLTSTGKVDRAQLRHASQAARRSLASVAATAVAPPVPPT